MSDSYFDTDDDELADSAFLNELDAIEAASQQPAKQPSQVEPVIVPTARPAAPKFKPVSVKTPSSDEFDDTFDIDAEELEKLDAFIADSYAGKAQPIAGPSGTRQTTLDGRVLPLSNEDKSGPKATLERSKSTGSKEQTKTKAWDRTTFSETGFRSTKKKDLKGKEKNVGKGKGVARDEGFDEEFDEENVEFEQFPTPYVDVGPPPPMRLKPDLLAAKDWIFPLNRPRRDYQLNIAKKCLFQNTLVALPTGLGKTFIAGVVMLNYYRWFPGGKIAFLAPTKPLAAQQITACHEVCGIPGSDAALMTGEVQRFKRSAAWAQKRVLYGTPQTFVNDLVDGIADPLDIILLVIDEAHRGTGDYSYAQAVRYMMAKNPHFRILALTATPGNNPEAVQRIVDCLHISHIEIRNEMSFDLQKYLFKKEVVVRVIKMDESILKIQKLLCKVMDPLLDRARKAGLLFQSSSIMLHPYSCIMGLQSINNRKDKARWMWAYMKVLGKFARAMGNLMESSSAACFRALNDLKESLIHSEKNDDKDVQLLKNPNFANLMQECEGQQALGFPPHPKMKALVEIIMDHFNSPLSNPETPLVGEGVNDAPSSNTRVMIFVGLREVIDEVVGVLDQLRPMLRAARFVGQGADKKGKRGLAQVQQLETIKKFKDGEFNILVSTSVGEEGLDIGEIDRIICYDSSKSSIQMLQRVGRTGRKRTGYVDVLLSEDREERNWDKSKENYADVQQTIISGNQLELYTDAERLLPDNIKPECLQTTMSIEPYIPETKASPRRAKDSTTKKRKRNDDLNRNIPLGAMTGFVSASKLRPKSSKTKKAKKAKDLRESDLEDDSDDAEIANGLRVASSTPKRKRKSSEAAKGKKGQRSLIDMLKAPLPDRLEDDEDDLDIQRGLIPAKKGYGSSDSSQGSVSPSLPRKQRRPLVASSSSSSSDHETAKAPPSSTAVSQPVPSRARGTSRVPAGKQKNVGWLLESGSEPEASGITTSQRAKSEKSKSNGKLSGFRSAKHLGVIETVSSPEPSADRLSPVVDVCERGSPLHEKDTNGIETSPPDPTFAVGRLDKRRPKKHLAAPPSSPMDEQTEVPRRLGRRPSPRLMGPPPVPPPRERNSMKPKLKLHDNPMLFDVEAAHSGDEVSEGDGSEVDMVESESDRRFLEELPETQASPSYNQTAAYRAGLMTQAPGRGPLFQRRRKRVGPFAGGRTQVPKPPEWSSSPRQNSELDEYEMGSFVVKDDDAILYDQSSEL